jgi:excisionase family DNA binding protein
MIAPSRQPESKTLRLAVNASELADGLALSVRTIMELVRENRIPHTYIGRHNFRFNLKAVQEWLDKLTVMPAEMSVGRPEQQAGSVAICESGRCQSTSSRGEETNNDPRRQSGGGDRHSTTTGDKEFL